MNFNKIFLSFFLVAFLSSGNVTAGRLDRVKAKVATVFGKKKPVGLTDQASLVAKNPSRKEREISDAQRAEDHKMTAEETKKWHSYFMPQIKALKTERNRLASLNPNNPDIAGFDRDIQEKTDRSNELRKAFRASAKKAP